LTGIYDLFRAIDWIVDLLMTIYEWFSNAIDELLEGMKNVLNFVTNFLIEIEEMFEDLFDLVLSIFG
jgi:uncharacterized protein Yka (UPF0111/DUF47 family)